MDSDRGSIDSSLDRWEFVCPLDTMYMDTRTFLMSGSIRKRINKLDRL